MNNYGYTAYPYAQNYPYNPFGQRFAPQGQQMTPQAQPQPQPQNSIPYEMPIQDIKFVNRAQAEAYIVYPNTKVMLIDNESGMVYIKTADGMGQSQTEYFRFDKVNADGSPIKPQDTSPQFTPEELDKKFVSFDKYEELVNRFEELKKFVGGLQNVGTKQN